MGYIAAMAGPRRTLKLNGSALLEALVARDEGLLATYVDLTDGRFLRLFDPAVTGRANEAVLSKVDADPDRYAEVPRYTRSYRLMADFVDTVDDDDLARLLDTALTGREAFRRFDAVLGGWPAERARWEGYRRSALTRWATAWLRTLGIEPDWELPPAPEAPPEVPALLEVALLGERGEGCASWSLATESEATRMFHRLARQLCELRSEPFRVRVLRGRTRFARGGVEIRRDGLRVVLSVLDRR